MIKNLNKLLKNSEYNLCRQLMK